MFRAEVTVRQNILQNVLPLMKHQRVITQRPLVYNLCWWSSLLLLNQYRSLGYGLDSLEFVSYKGQEIFSLLLDVHTEFHPPPPLPACCSMGTRALSQSYISLAAKLITHPPASPKFKNECSYNPTPLYTFRAWTVTASPCHLQTKSTHIDYSVSIFIFRSMPNELPLHIWFHQPHTRYVSYNGLVQWQILGNNIAFTVYLYRQWLLEHILSGKQGGVMRSAILHNLMLAVVVPSFCFMLLLLH
jgi:hypothetical protein